MARKDGRMARHETHPTARFATRDDFEAIRGVYAPYVDTPITFDVAVPSPAQFAARMDAVVPRYPCFVVECDGRVAGFAYAHALAERAAYRWNAELSIYLAPEATGRGWGARVYEALIELVRLQGIVCVYGLVTVPNRASERLHRSLGFDASWQQRHAGWKNGAWHDVTWFSKEINAPQEQPADPVPFDELLRTRPADAQQVLDRLNVALADR